MSNNSLNISGITEGYVLDHIKDGMSMTIYDYLELKKLNVTVAMIMHAPSKKMGRKDIIKIECPIGSINLDVLGYIDHNITVNVIKNDKIEEKVKLSLPEKVVNIIKCKNPRCITSIEQELDHVFHLSDESKKIYRCIYCETKH